MKTKYINRDGTIYIATGTNYQQTNAGKNQQIILHYIYSQVIKKMQLIFYFLRKNKLLKRYVKVEKIKDKQIT